MNNRVLFIHLYSKAESSSSSYYIEDVKAIFTNCGCDIHSVYPNPTRGLSDVEIEKKLHQKSENETYLYVNKNSSTSIFNRLNRLKKYTMKISRYLKRNKDSFDVVVVHSNPYVFLPYTIAKFCKKTDKKLIFIVNDIWPDIMKVHLPFINRINKKILKTSSCCVTLSNDMKSTLIRKGVSTNKIWVIRIWSDDIRVPDSTKSILDNSFFNVCYIGNIGYFQNIELILKVAKRLKRIKEVRFCLIGSGSFLKKAKKIVRNKHLSNVIFYGRVSDYQAKFEYQCASLNLLTTKRGVIRCACPSKTESIIKSHSPALVISDESEYSRMMLRYGCYVDSSFNAKSVVNKIIELKNNIQESQRNIIETEFDKQINIELWKKMIAFIMQLE